jgi:hypothetical protein
MILAIIVIGREQFFLQDVELPIFSKATSFAPGFLAVR